MGSEGRVHYYGEFGASLRQPERPDAAGWLDVAHRLMFGLVQVRVLAPLLTPHRLIPLRDAKHPSVDGHRVIAKAIADALREQWNL